VCVCVLRFVGVSSNSVVSAIGFNLALTNFCFREKLFSVCNYRGFLKDRCMCFVRFQCFLITCLSLLASSQNCETKTSFCLLTLGIDIIDYVTGIGNSSCEQISYVVTALVPSVSPPNTPKSATADAIAHAKLWVSPERKLQKVWVRYLYIPIQLLLLLMTLIDLRVHANDTYAT
jgi:hypothetical protein